MAECGRLSTQRHTSSSFFFTLQNRKMMYLYPDVSRYVFLSQAFEGEDKLHPQSGSSSFFSNCACVV